MQLMPFTAVDTQKDLKLATLRDPAVNVEVGTKYFASLMKKYDNNPVYALAAYNAGPHRVAKWRKDAKPNWGMIEFMESIPFKETRDYVMSILRNRYWYQYRTGAPNLNLLSLWVAPAAPADAGNSGANAPPAASATPVPSEDDADSGSQTPNAASTPGATPNGAGNPTPAVTTPATPATSTLGPSGTGNGAASTAPTPAEAASE
jgi:hypothetical protein